MGGFSLTEVGLEFGVIGLTMMACPETRMMQARWILDAIEQVARFDITDDGAVQRIGGPDDRVLIEAACF